jgi:short-subunit dehydrogenase
MSKRPRPPVIVITGASSGFGRGMALAFAAEGAQLVLAARRAHLLDGLAGECRLLGATALAVPTDVSQQIAIETLAVAAVTEFGCIDVWINNAGVCALGRFADVPIDDHAQVIDTTLLGTVYGSWVALREFRSRNAGVLINVASALGKIPAPYYASYVAAKHGVVGLSATLRQELGQIEGNRVRVCTVMPMAMDTPFFDHAANYTGHEAAPVPPLYDPKLVIDTIVRLVREPQDEVIVGGAGKAAAAAHALAPGLTRRMMARQTHSAQMEQAPRARHTAGAVHRPSRNGNEIHGGRLAH